MIHPAVQEQAAAFAGRQVCITGGAGFIGSHLADALAALGARVRLIDDFSNGRESNLSGAAAGAELVRGSVLDRDALDRAVAGAEVLFHQAALGSVPRSIELPERYHEVNATGTLRVLEAARRHGVRRVVYAASSSAYGNTPTLPKRESMPPDPRSPYAVSKLAGEHMMRAWALSYGLETVSLRYFNVFGPRQRHDSPYVAVIPMFAQALRAGRRPVIHGDGRQTRDFTHVANAVLANVLAAATPSRLEGQVVNVACGTRYSLLQLVEAIAAELGTAADPEFLPERAGDVRDSEADVGAARGLLGYRVIVPFREGLRATLAASAAVA